MAKLAVATVEDFDALKNPDTGLVPMRFLRQTLSEYVGDIRGAEPVTALRWYNEALAQPAVGEIAEKPVLPQGQTLTDEDRRRGEIVIAENWREQHHLALDRLAKRILGKDDGLTREQAAAAVQAEVERRDALARAPGGGVTSQNAPTAA